MGGCYNMKDNFYLLYDNVFGCEIKIFFNYNGVVGS